MPEDADPDEKALRLLTDKYHTADEDTPHEEVRETGSLPLASGLQACWVLALATVLSR